MISCTFAGHREVFGSCTQKIESALEALIENEDALYCYVGGMGEFDEFYIKKEYKLLFVLFLYKRRTCCGVIL